MHGFEKARRYAPAREMRNAGMMTAATDAGGPSRLRASERGAQSGGERHPRAGVMARPTAENTERP